MSLLIAPLEALTDARLTDPERRVLLVLFSFRNKMADTVWPSVESIAKRANIEDKTRVSKLTKALGEKGWIEKKRVSASGKIEYKLTLPAVFGPDNDDPKLVPETNLDQEANLAPQANEEKAKLVSQTNSKLVSQTNFHIELQSKQQNNNVRPIHGYDFSSWPEQPDPEVIRDWLAVRKQRRAKLTPTAIKRLAKTLTELQRLGHNVNDVLAKCITAGWTSFEVDWIHKPGQGQQSQNASSGDTFGGAW